MQIEITKKELIRIITSLPYEDISVEAFLSEGFGYYAYGSGDYKEYFWDLEVLETYTEGLLYSIYNSIVLDIELEMSRSEEKLKSVLKATTKIIGRVLEDDTSQDPPENPSIPMKVFLHIKNSKKATYWFEESNEGIHKSCKYQTIKEFIDDNSWVEIQEEDFLTDLLRIQIVHEKNFVDPIESEWVAIKDLQKMLDKMN